jgi:hypothetical protein
MVNHRSKTAKIRGFHLVVNTLLGLNELIKALLAHSTYVFVNEFRFNEHPLTDCLLRESKLFFPYQQHYCCSNTYIEILCSEQVCAHCW